MTEIELNRSSNGIDPTLHIWGYEIPIYLFIGGVVAGIMILSPLVRARSENGRDSLGIKLAPFMAIGLISLGMLFLFLDLAHKLHVYRFFAAFRLSSPMSWGSWILLGIYPVLLLIGVDGLSADDIKNLKSNRYIGMLKLGGLLVYLKRFTDAHRKGINAAGIVLGIGLGTYTGLLLSTLGVRHVWSASVLAPLFLVSGISTGAAFLLMMPLTTKEHHLLGRLDIAAIAVELILIGVFFIGLVSRSANDRAASRLFIDGPYAAIFWSVVVVAGLAAPLLLETLEIKKNISPTRIAPLLLLIGGLSLRWILVSAGQA